MVPDRAGKRHRLLGAPALPAVIAENPVQQTGGVGENIVDSHVLAVQHIDPPRTADQRESPAAHAAPGRRVRTAAGDDPGRAPDPAAAVGGSEDDMLVALPFESGLSPYRRQRSVAAAEDQEMLVGDIGQPARSPPVRHINDIIGLGAEKFRFVVSIHFCTSRTSSLISTPSAGGTSMN